MSGNTASVIIDGGSVFNNLAASEGGGLWNQAGSTLTVRNGTLIDANEALGNDATNGGGGIFNNGGIVNVIGVNTTISNNFASGTAGSGGGIFNDAGGTVSVTDAKIRGNVANRAGGGIEAVAGTTTNLTNVLLSMNNTGVAPDALAAPGNGGGLHITGAGNATITGGEVSDNVAALEGGGLWNGSGTLTINGTLITRNTARGAGADDGGGGVFNNGGTVNVTGATISNNLATGAAGSGGGLLSLAGPVTLSGTTIAFNSANRAGGGVEIIVGALALTNSNLISNDVSGGSGTPSPGNGGGLHVSGNTASVIIDGGSVFNNLAASEGGGLWNQAGSTLTVRNGTLIDANEALGNDATNGGGGIFNNGGIVNVIGVNTTISNNFASGTAGSGGGIFNDAGGTVSVTDAKIRGNVANRAGGGIEAVAGTTTNLTNVLLSMNNTGVAPDAVAAPGNGGGLHITGAGNATITGGEVSDNVAALEGGGLWNGSGTITISGTLITRNTARGAGADDGGGGVFNNGGTVNVTGATISNNLATGAAGSGGGLLSLSGPVTLSSTTIAFNSANRAGGAIEALNGNLNISFSSFSSNNVNGGAGVANPGNGGAIHTSGNAAVTIQSGSFTGNEAAREGGAIWIQGSGSLNTSSNVLFVNNSAHGPAADDGGGALFNNGGSVVLLDTLMFANRADGASGSGGAIFNLGGSILATNLFVGTNMANRAGGGIEDSGGTLQLNNSTLSNNSALSSPGNGGGLHITGNSVVGLDRTLVTQNFASAEGGGLWNSSSGTLTIVNSTVDRNSSATGGGIFNDGAGGIVRVLSSTISRNRVTGNGGGVLSEGGRFTALNSTVSSNSAINGGGIQVLGGTAELTSVTIAANTASSSGGGAHVLAGTLTAMNTLVATNAAPLGTDIFGTMTSVGNNLIGTASGAVIVGTTTGDQTNLSPMLGPLQNNGGPTETHALLTSSPARDAGSSAVDAVDQRGIVRPQNAAFDIGAYEALATASPSALRADVSGDGFISAIDVLLIINRINGLTEEGEGEAEAESGREVEDVNGDGYVSPVDALLVINILNAGPSDTIVLNSMNANTVRTVNVDLLLAGADALTWIDQLRKKEFDFGLTATEEEAIINALASDQIENI